MFPFNIRKALDADAASGAVPLLNSWAWENQSAGAVMALPPLEPWLLSPHWRENWINFAKEPSSQFAKSADGLVESLRVVQAAMQTDVSSE